MHYVCGEEYMTLWSMGTGCMSLGPMGLEGLVSVNRVQLSHHPVVDLLPKSFFYDGSPFFGGKKNFPSQIRATRRQRRHSTCPLYTLVRYTSKQTRQTNMQSIQSARSHSESIHQGIQGVCKTQDHVTNNLKNVRVNLN
jgi:hypothetical protein